MSGWCWLVWLFLLSPSYADLPCIFPEWSSQPVRSQFECDDAGTCPSCGRSKCGSKDKEGCIDKWLPRANVCLPFLAEEAEARGFTLPLPIGFSAISTVMQRNVAVSDVRIAIGDGAYQSLDRVSVDPFAANATNEVGRIDAWIVPFFNVYGVAGHTRTRANLDVNVERFPFPGSPPVAIPIQVRLDGFTYGGGGTLAVGTKKVFATLDMNYTHTDFDSLASELFALVITPRIGLVVDRPCFKGAVHVGAMYQDTEQTIDVELSSPVLGDIKVAVDQFEPDPWNFLVGTLWAIDERFHVMAELGMGGRKYVISGLTLRF